MNEAELRAIYESIEGHQPHTLHWNTDGTPKYINRLINTQSPYLIRHAHNPVDWRLWEDSTFAEAKRLGRPVMLSIGYSTCHWCAVMARESFEDEELAQLINETVIPIKVDRELRPDLDAIFMDYTQITTGSGGWPLTVFITPDQRPLLAATYLPPNDGDRDVKIGLKSYLKVIAKHWSDPGLQAQSDEPLEVLQTYALQAPSSALDPIWIDTAMSGWIDKFDADWGGFSDPPKFPRPVQLEALLRAWHRDGDARLLKAVEVTLERMYCGGIFDHIGGGFSRYSVDNRWWTPHFEKMLSDNAQLAVVYLDVYQITRKPFYAQVARELLRYMVRELRSPSGGFYTAQDAESRTPSGELVEGYYYTWTLEELRDLCTDEEIEWVQGTFGLSEEGNFDDGRNLFRLYEPLNDEERDYWAPIRARLLDARQLRSAPFTDDKVVCIWNALAISAFTKGACILGEPEWYEYAQQCAEFIYSTFFSDRELVRAWRQGEVSTERGLLEDYMGLSNALIDVFEMSGQAKYLRYAMDVYEQGERFFDPERGGFFRVSESDRDILPFIEKPLIDASEPSGNSLAALVALRLSDLTEKPHYRAQASSTLKAIGALLSTQPEASPKALSALCHWLEGRGVIAITQLQSGTEKLLHPLTRTSWGSFKPYAIRLTIHEVNDELRALVPSMEVLESKVSKPVVHICSSGGCSSPIHTSALFKDALARL